MDDNIWGLVLPNLIEEFVKFYTMKIFKHRGATHSSLSLHNTRWTGVALLQLFFKHKQAAWLSSDPHLGPGVYFW